MKRYFVNADWNMFFTAEPVGSRLYLERGEPGGAVNIRWTEQYPDGPECRQNAERWISEEQSMGYVETTAADPAVAAAVASTEYLPALQLLPEKVRGQRIKLAHFTWYRLGSREEVTELLTTHGATVLDEADDATEFDFYLGGLALASGVEFRRPVVFEEELCAPLAPAGELAWFKPRLWAMLRELLGHPAIVVNLLSLGLPATAQDLAEREAELGRPLPRLVREFYQQVGQLQLLWVYRGREATVLSEGMFNIDRYDEHQGDINIWPLTEVLAGEWTNPAYDYGYDRALQPNQKLFDFYSEYHQMAIELGDDDDPLLYLGDDYGVSFDDDKPIRFSDYLSLLLHTYGFKERERLLETTLHGQFAITDETALQGLAALELHNPFRKDLDVPPNFASQHDDDYVAEETAEEAPDDDAASQPAAAPIDPPVSELLDSAAGRTVEARLVAVESPFPITDSAHKATFAVYNPGSEPLTVLGYVAEFVAATEAQELVLDTDDSATHRDPMQGYTHVSNGMFLFFSAPAGLCIEPLHLSEMPVQVPAGHRTMLHLYLHHLDIPAALAAAGLAQAASYHLRVAVQLASGEVLRAQHAVDVVE